MALMEYLKVAGISKSSLKRRFRTLRDQGNQLKHPRASCCDHNEVEEDMLKVQHGVVSETQQHVNGVLVVRLKVVIRKQELGQFMKLVRGEDDSVVNGEILNKLTVEQRLHEVLMRRKKVFKGIASVKINRRSRKGCWSPVLQTIPEH